MQGNSQGYPSSNHTENNQLEHQTQYSPATQISAQSDAHHQAWQQYWQWQAYQQSQQQQQQQGQHQETSHFTHPDAVPVTGFVTYNNGSQPPNPLYLQAGQSDSTSQVHQIQSLQTQGYQTPTAIAISGHHNLQTAEDSAEIETDHQRRMSGSSVSMQSHSTSASHSKRELFTEGFEEGDLNLLDLPDMPKDVSSTNKSVHLPNTIVSPPISLIGMPLPANFVVADALYPISSPPPESEGRCQSRYLRDVTLDGLCENIKSSKYWKDHKDDTAFFDRPDDEHVVTVDEIRAQVRERYTKGESSDEFSRQTRSESRNGTALRKDSIDTRTRLEQLEIEKAETLAKIAAKMASKEKMKASKKGEQMTPPHSSAEGRPNDEQAIVKDEQFTPPQSAAAESAMTYRQDTEDILAALGVTGSPKPVTAPNGVYKGFMHEQPNGARVSLVRQQSDLPKSGTTSVSPGFGSPPPPPPPPPLWQASIPNGGDGSASSAVPGWSNGHAFATNGFDCGNENYNNGTEGEVLSPNELPYDQLNTRKRSYNRRDSSSSEEDIPARRQEDDVTPKLKRHQPKVAAAYR